MAPKSLLWQSLANLEHYAHVSDVFENSDNAIVNYHSVSTNQRGLFGNISPKRFRRDMEFFSDNYEIVDLPEVLDSGQTTGKKIAITFDDGYTNFYTTVLPILEELAVPATVFINPGFVGDRNKDEIISAHSLSDIHSDIILNREQIETLIDSDLITIGNHTATHANLNELEEEYIIESEICGAKEQLETEFGISVDRFSYPYGSYSEAAIETVQRSHDLAVGTNYGLIPADPDRHRLPRLSGHKQERIVRWETTDLAQRTRQLYEQYLL